MCRIGEVGGNGEIVWLDGKQRLWSDLVNGKGSMIINDKKGEMFEWSMILWRFW